MKTRYGARTLTRKHRKIAEENLSRILGCSRICKCQSTQEPQGSIGIGVRTVNISIKSTYFHSISTGFHKRFDLLWEQRVGGPNPLHPYKRIRSDPGSSKILHSGWLLTNPTVTPALDKS